MAPAETLIKVRGSLEPRNPSWISCARTDGLGTPRNATVRVPEPTRDEWPVAELRQLITTARRLIAGSRGVLVRLNGATSSRRDGGNSATSFDSPKAENDRGDLIRFFGLRLRSELDLVLGQDIPPALLQQLEALAVVERERVESMAANTPN